MANDNTNHPAQTPIRIIRTSASTKLSAPSLSSMLRDTPGSIDDLLPVMVRVLHAVADIERKDDLPFNPDPGQILLHEDGGVSIATISPAAAGQTFTLSSAKYTSPELLQQQAPTNSKAAASYMLGFVFYELLLGHNLFDQQFEQVRQSGNAGWLLWHADSLTRLLPARQLLPGIPSFISDTLSQMTAKNPSERMTDLELVAQIFGRASASTSVYRVVADQHAGGTRPMQSSTAMPAQHSGPRPWLVRLARHHLWKRLWKRVTPEDPRPGWQSIQELERMLCNAEAALQHLGSRLPSSDRRQRVRG